MVGKQTSRDCQGILDNEGARRNAGGEVSPYPRGFFIKSSANYGNEGEREFNG